MTIYPVILAGGSGTRLWPLSREYYPKQFLPLISESSSMLQETLARLELIEEAASPILVCSELHRFIIADQLREVGVEATSIIVEPAGRNTAPALTLGSVAGAGRSGGRQRSDIARDALGPLDYGASPILGRVPCRVGAGVRGRRGDIRRASDRS